MHVETHLLHGGSNVWPCKGQILQGADHAAVPRIVAKRVHVVDRGLGLGVRWGAYWFTISHADALEHLVDVLGLGQEEATLCVLHLNAEEEM
jgi:hypothetical protein